jgi:hypothetical protein
MGLRRFVARHIVMKRTLGRRFIQNGYVCSERGDHVYCYFFGIRCPLRLAIWAHELRDKNAAL